MLRLWQTLAPSCLYARQMVAVYLLWVLGCGVKESRLCRALSAADLRGLVTDAKPYWADVSLLCSLPDSCWEEADGVTALAALGEYDFIWFRGEIGYAGHRLENLVARHSFQGGLWRLLATTCVFTNYKPNLSGLVPNSTAFTDPRHQVAVLQVQLAQARWSEAEATTMAEQLAALNGTVDNAVAHALTIIEEHKISGRPVESFLAALLTALPHSAWQARREVVKAMQEQQRQRLSDTENLS